MELMINFCRNMHKLNGSGPTSVLMIVLGLLLFSRCQSEFIPDNINLSPELVVEGFIEYADDALPPYILLTQSRPFFTSLSVDQLDNLFVHNASVSVTFGAKRVALNEICLNDLTPDLKRQISFQLGINPDSLQVNICAYIDLSGQLIPKEGETYTLDIQSNGQEIKAVTTIPRYVPLDTLWWKEAPGKPSDTLLQLLTRVKEPAGEKNFYRYFCSINNGQERSPFNSVYDDALIDGKDFEFRLVRPDAPGEKFDQSTFGLFHIGDSITVKWSTIDEAHFNFWNTLEFNKGSQGPFSSYTTINSNIIGGLGIWGGYNSRTYHLKVQR